MEQISWRYFPEKHPVLIWGEDASCVPGWDGNISGQDMPSLTPYLLDGICNPCVIVCPGGGYAYKAMHESENIALWLNSVGFSSLVLDYRVHPYHHPIPLLDAQRAIRYTRANAQTWGIDADRIAIMGFSAGGHLSASASVYFDLGDPAAQDPIQRYSSRPDAAILCYPVIEYDVRPYAPPTNLLGEIYTGEQFRQVNLDQHVRSDMPPVFLFHTAQDQLVNVRHSLCFAQACCDANVPTELHIYPEGPHGVSLAEGTHTGRWPAQLEAFLKNIWKIRND